MKLTDLSPQYIQYRCEQVDPSMFIDGAMHTTGIRITMPYVDSLTEAHGIKFLCPLCVSTNHHSVICWFEDKVPEDAQPGPGRWNPTGTGFEDLSFVPGKKSSSVQLIGGCGWHGHIINGEVTVV